MDGRRIGEGGGRREGVAEDIDKQQTFYSLLKRYKQIRRFEQRPFEGHTNSRLRVFARNVESVCIV